MHAAFDQNKRFISKTKQDTDNCKGSLYIILNFLSNKTNLIYIAICVLSTNQHIIL